jgi:hypothetical protein
MKKFGILVLFVVVASTMAGWGVSQIQAYPQFKKEFDNLYVKENPVTPEEKSLKEAATAAKCAICHTNPEKDKKVRNTYGKAIEELVPKGLDKEGKEKLKKDATQIKDLLEKAAKEHSEKGDPNSPTFGDLIKEGKLPGKDVEEKK